MANTASAKKAVRKITTAGFKNLDFLKPIRKRRKTKKRTLMRILHLKKM